MDWTKILETVLTNAVFLSILGFVAKSVFEHLLSKDIDKFKLQLQAMHDKEMEKYRAELRLAAFEHETRFAKLHENRAMVVARLYKSLAQIQRHIQSALDFVEENRKTGPTQEQIDTTVELVEGFQNFFNEHRIYLSEDLCAKIDELGKNFS